MQKLMHPLFAVGAAALMIASAPASAADDYYKGKTVRFIVGFGVGGGYDAYSRMIAPELAKRLGATVIVENQPGAGGLNALNRFSRAPGNGLEITIVNGTGVATQQILGTKGLRFDLTKLKYLGITDHSRWQILASPKSSYRTVQDLLNAKEPIRFGASGKLDALGVGGMMACTAIKLKCRVIAGYKGSSQVSLALAQGEVDAIYVSETSALKYAKAGSAVPIVTWNRKRSKLFPNLKAIPEVLSLTPDQLWWIDVRNTIEGLGRMLVAPPSTPKAQVDTLRTAVDSVLTNKAFVAAAKKRNREIKYIKAAEAKKMVERVLSEVTPQEKAKIRTVLLGKK